MSQYCQCEDVGVRFEVGYVDVAVCVVVGMWSKLRSSKKKTKICKCNHCLKYSTIYTTIRECILTFLLTILDLEHQNTKITILQQYSLAQFQLHSYPKQLSSTQLNYLQQDYTLITNNLINMGVKTDCLFINRSACCTTNDE